MKKAFFVFLILVPVFCFSQVDDSLRIAAEVDSLLKTSQGWLKKRNFEKALNFNMEAEKIAEGC